MGRWRCTHNPLEQEQVPDAQGAHLELCHQGYHLLERRAQASKLTSSRGKGCMAMDEALALHSEFPFRNATLRPTSNPLPFPHTHFAPASALPYFAYYGQVSPSSSAAFHSDQLSTPIPSPLDALSLPSLLCILQPGQPPVIRSLPQLPAELDDVDGSHSHGGIDRTHLTGQGYVKSKGKGDTP